MTKVVEPGKTAMRKQKDWEFSLSNNLKVYLSRLLAGYKCYVIMNFSEYKSKLHFGKICAGNKKKICHRLQYP